MALSPLPDYPWDAMAPFLAEASAHPDGLIDLSIGSPVDETPAIVRDALAVATDAHGYPATIGTPELRAAVVEWFARRRGVVGLTTDQVIPSIGSKEFVAFLAYMLGLGDGDVVVHPQAAYPTYAVGAAMSGATAVASDDPADWPEKTRLVWLNSPGNPDGRVLDVGALRSRVERARELGAVIVGDECYAELGWDAPWDTEPIPSILDRRVTGGDDRGVVAIYSLSKQSNMAGYRAAFAAGCRDTIARLTTVRKHAGLMVPAPLQRAMTVALSDDVHVERQKQRYRDRRDVLRPALERAGFRIDGSEAGLYLWATEGRPSWDSIARLARLGILGGPGPFYGSTSPEHVRLSLTATDERVAAAAGRLSALA
ncbi:succinyldiaminopimelate aminotransferase [Labedella gwakjiensis]|uniref:Aminotransferase n=1 Tax=Labedella gwakjiensis TaxID=390269 RepID=A0A2P8H126_9MICO|nr:succinyldiaminopimelate transaminase [Labedella gwakjiensis]PSL39919.1 succinyldiaminopimelate aminotransferase [Labedella gwakjiensis]RUQ85719.1 succinyldiaminopimelate transaminase [Labedella gwakjiensis]